MCTQDFYTSADVCCLAQHAVNSKHIPTIADRASMTIHARILCVFHMS